MYSILSHFLFFAINNIWVANPKNTVPISHFYILSQNTCLLSNAVKRLAVRINNKLMMKLRIDAMSFYGDLYDGLKFRHGSCCKMNVYRILKQHFKQSIEQV